MAGNPCSEFEAYRLFVIGTLPQLKSHPTRHKPSTPNPNPNLHPRNPELESRNPNTKQEIKNTNPYSRN